MYLRFFFCFFFLCNLSSIYNQSCQGFYKTSRCAVKHPSEFKQYGQARSAKAEIGTKYKYVTILYGQKDYIISVCSEFHFSNIHFKIFDDTNRTLIYDNEEDNFDNGVAFSVENTLNVEIEIEILGDKMLNNDPDKYRGCVGIQMLWRKIPKMGF